MDTGQVWEAVEQQRLDLADFLETLEPEAWDRSSLCEGWRVREVAAHVTLAARARPLQAVAGLLRARGSFNGYVRADAIARAGRRPQELVADLRAVAGVRHHPPATKPIDTLVDVLVHGQDIAVPLGIDRPMRADAAVAAAERVWAMSFPFFARRRFRGTRLRATNADWARGEGDEIQAPIERLLLLLTGRQVEAR
jgi:uncharacterized protein (TIGR03083 family)